MPTPSRLRERSPWSEVFSTVMLDVLERGFRRSAMWAYTMNQSRAKVVMDPIYLATARRLLRGTRGRREKLSREKLASTLYLPYRALSRKLAYYIEDWDFGEARPDLL